jgi:aspartate carbamoyltransferase catalytic subunit
MKNFLSVKQLDREKIEKLLISAMEIEKMFHAPFRPREFWSNKTMASFFGEASTRTRISFERAMHWLGGSVVTAADASASSSLRKGESIRDTLYTLSQYSDVIVFRHPDETWINEADAASVPVINAGNGSDEHPTQAMLDLLTIYKKFGRTSNLKFLFCGDLRHSRTVRSLIQLLKLYEGNEFLLCPAKHPEYSFNYQENDGSYVDHVADVADADVIYMTRIQDERFPGIDTQTLKFPILTRKLVENLGQNAIILHPLPRRAEIHTDVDEDHRAVYKDQQIRNGLYIRIAILKELLNHV